MLEPLYRKADVLQIRKKRNAFLTKVGLLASLVCDIQNSNSDDVKFSEEEL